VGVGDPTTWCTIEGRLGQRTVIEEEIDTMSERSRSTPIPEREQLPGIKRPK
jgi:hypothetical protein